MLLHLLAYAAAGALYLAFHAGQRDAVARGARAALVAGVALHTVEIALRCVRGQHPAASVAEAMSFIAWAVAGGYLLASLRYRLHAAGAFAIPAALVLVLLARVVPATAVGPAQPGVLGMVHIALATLGVAMFALATVIASLYLLQEKRLKRRDLTRLRGTGAPLETLDRLAARCVSVGFPVFTVALITGAVWVARLGVVQGTHPVRPEYVAALASWVAFGVLLVARAGGGWQGRRAAWLTLAGFSGVMLVVLSYFVRSAV
jgi:ABC-type uncharacterized transport system permease subunit